MSRLILASLIWAFSFGLIKRYLTGLHPDFVAAARLALSTLLFLAWAKFPRSEDRQLHKSALLQLLAIGAVEFGLMYVCYLTSFQTLESWQIALFTSLTPVAVLLIASGYRGNWNSRKLIPVVLASLATGLLALKTFVNAPSLKGFLLVQASNLCFAWGQVHHAHLRRQLPPETPAGALAFWEYLGGLLVTGLVLIFQPSAFPASLETLWSTQGLVLLYSGLVASGLAFFLWNSGASAAAPATLAVLNNLKAPLAATVSLVVFRERAELQALILALALFAFGLGLARWLERSEKALLDAKGP